VLGGRELHVYEIIIEIMYGHAGNEDDLISSWMISLFEGYKRNLLMTS
jgi:hypothetical protein